ncbi:MAG: hypothetical protein IKY78_08600 [Clostridia bacterium]|nr:hypothetical protein [Clostridia bacterium]
MIGSLLYFFCLLLVIVALFLVFYIITLKREITDEGFFVAVEGYESDERLAEEVFSALIQINLFNLSSKKPVYVIDRDLTDETRDILTKQIEPYGKIIFVKCTDDEFILL